METIEPAKTRQKVQVRTSDSARENLDAISRGSIVVMGGISALIGLWAAACFVSALFGSGGLLALTRSWLQAVTGM